MTILSLECARRTASMARIEMLAQSDATVLIGGETGSGKGILARQLHALSRRTNEPFVIADCSALTVSLFESQMFGHVKGAFTGASSDRLGLVRAADGGTLFLDEVGELALESQAKLLTLIEERTVLPVGSERRLDVNFRLIAATHRDLPAMVKAGEFREDLYYRVAVVELSVPPLRERREEVPMLIDELIERKANLLGMQPKRASAECYMALLDYPWPGNVRELGHAIERAMVMSRGDWLELDALPPRVVSHWREHPHGHSRLMTEAMRRPEHIAGVLKATAGNKAEAARKLGISRRHLYRLLNETA